MINLSSNTAVVHITYEGITNFVSLTNFEKKNIESITTTETEKILSITYDPAAGINAKPSIPGAKTSLILISQLIVAVQYSKYYTSIYRMMNATNMRYGLFIVKL